MKPFSLLLAAGAVLSATTSGALAYDRWDTATGIRWGALAFGPPPERLWAWSINQPTAADAAAAAIVACGPACSATLVFPFGCAAIATGAGDAIGISTTRFQTRAMAWALNRCNRRGPDCEVVAVVCTGPGTENLDQVPEGATIVPDPLNPN